VIDFRDAYEEHVWDVYAFFAYRVSARSDAEDLTQLTFERALRAWTRFDERRASARTWLLAIARNLLIDHYRADRSDVHEPLDTYEARAGELPSLERPRDLGIAPELAAALVTLSQRDREVIALRFGGDLTGPEIAELLDLTVANVQQILSRALRKMRAQLDHGEPAVEQASPPVVAPERAAESHNHAELDRLRRINAELQERLAREEARAREHEHERAAAHRRLERALERSREAQKRESDLRARQTTQLRQARAFAAQDANELALALERSDLQAISLAQQVEAQWLAGKDAAWVARRSASPEERRSASPTERRTATATELPAAGDEVRVAPPSAEPPAAPAQGPPDPAEVVHDLAAAIREWRRELRKRARGTPPSR
jgi:RNA polymerase sigma-70 factor, ECF subfamily